MHNNSSKFRFCFDSGSAGKFENLNERDYLVKVFEYLPKYFDLKGQFTFYLYSSQDSDSYPESYLIGKRQEKILIFISDENGKYPSHLTDGYFAIFKMYLNPENFTTSSGNVFPFPLGVVTGTRSYPPIDIQQRKLDVFYSGNLNDNRFDLYQSLARSRFSLPAFIVRPLSSHIVKRIWRRIFLKYLNTFDSLIGVSIIRFTDKFKAGFSLLEYSEIIRDSKIVLCPKGFHSTETFRLYEAMRQGCIVISENLPNSEFYSGAPIIQIENWKDIRKLCVDLLQDVEYLREMSVKSMCWYKLKFSEEAVAKYIASSLNSLSSLDG